MTIGTRGAANTDAADTAASVPPSGALSLNGQAASAMAGLAGDTLGAALGRRYRPLENGRMADTRGKTNGLTEEQKSPSLTRFGSRLRSTKDF